MKLCTTTLPTLEENLALDEALLLQAEEETTAPLLRVWEWQRLAVVLGAAGKVAEDVKVERCQQDEVTLARRSSGGGTVLLGQGCLMYSLVLPYDLAEELTTITSSYSFLLGQVCKALSLLDVEVRPCGISDLAIAGQKVSGNAQQRKRLHLLHHGTLLYAFPVRQVSRYLQPPIRQPEYRQQRGHDDFLRNLPATREQILEALIRYWHVEGELPSLPDRLVARLVREKYSLPDWVYRR